MEENNSLKLSRRLLTTPTNQHEPMRKFFIATSCTTKCWSDLLLLCCCSLSDSHLSQSCVGDDHRVNKRPAAAHLPHLLRHACSHGRLLRLPDQVSQGFLSLLLCTFFFFSFSLFSIAQIRHVHHRLDAILAFQFLNKLRKIIYWTYCTCSTPTVLWWIGCYILSL